MGVGLRIHFLWQSGGFGKTERSIEGDAALSCHTALGGNDDHTIRPTRTIDSGRRRVLQNLHTFDVFGIDAFQSGFTHHTVHYIKRIVALVDGVRTTDADFHRTARNPIAHHIDTCHTSLQGIAHLGNRLCLECLVVHHRYGTCHVGLTHCTIADDHHFVQCLSIFLQYNVQWFPVPCHLLVLVTYIRYHNDITRLHPIQGKASVQVGDRSMRSPFNHYRSANDRHPRHIFHHTGTLTVLLHHFHTE